MIMHTIRHYLLSTHCSSLGTQSYKYIVNFIISHDMSEHLSSLSRCGGVRRMLHAGDVNGTTGKGSGNSSLIESEGGRDSGNLRSRMVRRLESQKCRKEDLCRPCSPVLHNGRYLEC